MTDPSGSPHATRIAFSFPAVTASIGEVRHLIVSEAQTLPFDADDLDDIALAVSEAFTNLVQHAEGYRIRGVCEVTSEQLEIRFEIDQEAGPYLERRQFPTGLSHSGRGIPLLHLLIPTVEVRTDAGGKSELRLVKPVPQIKEPT